MGRMVRSPTPLRAMEGDTASAFSVIHKAYSRNALISELKISDLDRRVGPISSIENTVAQKDFRQTCSMLPRNQQNVLERSDRAPHQGNRISRHLRGSDQVFVVPSGAPELSAQPGFIQKRGGGVFFAKMPPMLLMGLGLLAVPWGDLHAFAPLLATFWRGAGRRGQNAAEEPRAKTRTGLAFVVSHPCLKNKGPARIGHPDRGQSGVAVSTIFRTFSSMVLPLQRINSIVRLWALIARRVEPVYFALLVVCFVGFSDGAEIGGLDKNWGPTVPRGGISERDQVCVYLQSPHGWRLPQHETFIRPRGSNAIALGGAQVSLVCNPKKWYGGCNVASAKTGLAPCPGIVAADTRSCAGHC